MCITEPCPIYLSCQNLFHSAIKILTYQFCFRQPVKWKLTSQASVEGCIIAYEWVTWFIGRCWRHRINWIFKIWGIRWIFLWESKCLLIYSWITVIHTHFYYNFWTVDKAHKLNWCDCLSNSHFIPTDPMS